MKQKSDIFSYIFLSIFAALLIITLIYFNDVKTNIITLYDRLLIVGFCFIGSVFGISLAFYPRWYKKSKKASKKSEIKKDEMDTYRSRKGHHPDCEKFKNHIVRFNSKVFCTGCLGLAIGAFSSIFLMLIYIAINRDIQPIVSYLLLFLGLILIGFNFIEIMLPTRHKIIHIFLNIFLMIGFLMVVIGVFEITKSKTNAIISIIFTFLWLHTRIQLSNLRHSIICGKCKERCKMY